MGPFPAICYLDMKLELWLWLFSHALQGLPPPIKWEKSLNYLKSVENYFKPIQFSSIHAMQIECVFQLILLNFTCQSAIIDSTIVMISFQPLSRVQESAHCHVPL